VTKTPAEAETPRRNLRRYAIALAILLLVAGGAAWSLRNRDGEPQTTPSPSAAPAATSDVEKDIPLKTALAPEFPKETRPVPKVRVIPIEALPKIVAGPSSADFVSSSVPAEKVDEALRRAIAYLRERSERWLTNSRFPLGYASLPGLALLEAGVEPSDPVIEKAAKRVRELAPSSTHTYEVGLAILFLDRLGDPADVPLIRSLALRLIAAQGPQGGWTYTCPLVTNAEPKLLAALEKTRPDPHLGIPLARETGKGLLDLPIPLAGNKNDKEKPTPKATGLVMPFEIQDEGAKLVRDLPDSFRRMPIFGRGFDESGGVHGDNSNSQFALLALWTARRHGVPVERSLLLADQRYARTQGKDGSWSYTGRGSGQPAMTCVGLLGLAVGHGSLLGSATSSSAAAGVDDPAIRKGLEALARSVGSPTDPPERAQLNLYFLWSLERVAMLYRLPTLGGKDWYGWGANILLKRQQPNGSWDGSVYPGHDAPLDTAFGLLFLRRSNLVQDLTDRLQLHMAIRDPEQRRD
jgi:hypothetical protein